MKNFLIVFSLVLLGLVTSSMAQPPPPFSCDLFEQTIQDSSQLCNDCPDIKSITFTCSNGTLGCVYFCTGDQPCDSNYPDLDICGFAFEDSMATLADYELCFCEAMDIVADACFANACDWPPGYNRKNFTYAACWKIKWIHGYPVIIPCNAIKYCKQVLEPICENGELVGWTVVSEYSTPCRPLPYEDCFGTCDYLDCWDE
jgi:hypothetical protein